MFLPKKMNPFKMVSGRRSKCKSKQTQVVVKQEPVIKEVPNIDIIDVSRPRDEGKYRAIYEGSVDRAFDSDEIKDEIKSEEEATCKEEDSASCERQNKFPDANGDDNEHEIAEIIDIKPSRSVASAKKRSGKSRKPNRRTIPRNQAAKKQQKHKCHVCIRSFDWKNNLKIHLRCHTGERPFQCDVCLKSFLQKGSLNRHKKMHGHGFDR